MQKESGTKKSLPMSARIINLGENIMTPKHIIFVPGKNPESRDAQYSELLWKTLIEGVRRVDSSIANAIQAHVSELHLISWNHIFYQTYIDITHDIPWINALLNQHEPTEQDIQAANSWSNRLGRIIMKLADNVPLIIPLLPHDVENTAIEIDRYFYNIQYVASNIRRLLKQTLRPLIEKNESVLLIGHSFGSVIAYDTLWELSHQDGLQGGVDFLSIGSPLGMHYMQQRLMGMKGNREKSYPELIRHWINLSSEGDIVALERNFHNSFKEMLKQGLVKSIEDYNHHIYNHYHDDEGLDCHRSYGYMVNPAVGSIIAEWWKRN
jgi:hypothetical protein